MAGLTDSLRVEHYGAPLDELTLDDVQPDLEDCGLGLSDDSLLHWPQLSPR